MSDEIKYAYLKSHPLFANTGEQKILEACSIVKVKTVFRGETLSYGEGDYSKVYLLIKGKIKITECDAMDNELIKDILTAPDLFGDLGLAGNPSMDEFAEVIDKIPKIVFSRTLKNVEWKTARLAKRDIKEEVLELRQEAGKDILVGSPSLIVALSQLELIDEYQLGVQPTVLGSGLPLFKDIRDRIDLKLLKTKTFGGGAVMLYYESIKK